MWRVWLTPQRANGKMQELCCVSLSLKFGLELSWHLECTEHLLQIVVPAPLIGPTMTAASHRSVNKASKFVQATSSNSKQRKMNPSIIVQLKLWISIKSRSKCITQEWVKCSWPVLGKLTRGARHTHTHYLLYMYLHRSFGNFHWITFALLTFHCCVYQHRKLNDPNLFDVEIFSCFLIFGADRVPSKLVQSKRY